MASLTHLGKAFKNRLCSWSLPANAIRYGSGYRGSDDNDANARVRAMRSTGTAAQVTSSMQQVRFLPASARTSSVNEKDSNAVGYGEQPTNNQQQEPAPTFGRRKKRSSETIRHDQLYLQDKGYTEREFKRTWNDFQDKRDIPVTEWGKRLSK